MREIKFRAWDETNKVMIYGVNINGGKPVRPGYQWFNAENAILHSEPQQYTGLKDKNGREIYEGDIVRCYGGAYWNGVYEFDNVIEVKDIRDLNDIMYSEYVEILGNKFENPELLGRVRNE